MPSFKSMAMFTLGVALATLVINQIGPVREIVNKSYFG